MTEDDYMSAAGDGDEDTASLIKGVVYEDAPDVEVKGPSSRRCNGLRVITVQPIVCLFMFACGLVDPTVEAFIYYKVCLVTINDTTICGSLSNGSYTVEEDLVQASSSRWKLAMTLCYMLPSFVVSFVYGALSDRVSRKLALLLPSIGHLIGAVMLLLNVSNLNWPIAAVVVGPLIAGLGGGWVTFLLAGFSYLSEVSSEDNRIIHIVVVETIISISFAISSFLSGVILDTTSFRFVSWLAIGFNAAAVVYTAVRIKEISRRRTDDELVTCGRFCASVCHPTELRKTAMVVAKKRKASRRPYIVAILVIVFLEYVAYSPIPALGYLYVKRNPLGWSQTLYGQFRGSSVAITGMGSLIFVPLFKKTFNVTETMMLLASLVSTTVSILMFGISVKTWMLFLVPVVGVITDVQFTCLRSMLSKLVEKHELGQAFAMFAATQCMGEIVGSTAFNNSYPITLQFWNGLCFLIGAIISLLPIVLSIWLHRHMTRNTELRPSEEVITTEVIANGDEAFTRGNDSQPQTTDDIVPDHESAAADCLLSPIPHS